MADEIFEAGPGAEAARVVADVRETVERKMREGAYADARVAAAERTNLVRLSTDESFSAYYLRCLRDAVYVDISDFEIRERRARFAPLLVRMKKAIWSLLKFYTYRLWSQQNQVNGLLVTGIEAIDEKTEQRIRRLEARVAELEKRLGERAP
jgi:hypothetical protein